MDSAVVLRVRLRVPDTVALSAEDVLRRKMGYGPRVGGLRREDWWRFEVETDDPARAAGRVETWAARCTALVNPNKHRARIEAVKDWPPGTTEAEVMILVRDREDVRARSMLGFLTDTLGASDLRSLASGTLWILRPGAGERDGRALAEEIAITRSRTSGLLANPHAQVVEVWA